MNEVGIATRGGTAFSGEEGRDGGEGVVGAGVLDLGIANRADGTAELKGVFVEVVGEVFGDFGSSFFVVKADGEGVTELVDQVNSLILRGNERDVEGVLQEIRERERGEAGGLLSLTMALEGQADAAVKKFRYLGTETAGSGIGLDVVYENRATGWTGRWFWIAALAFVGWLVPPTARTLRVLWSVLGLTLPLALAPLAPLPWQNMLDGIFFGTLAAIALWTLRCVCESLCGAWPRMKTKAFWMRSLSRSKAG